MSIVVDNSDIDIELTEICKKLYMQNKVLVASVANGKEYSIPACLKTVIGVRGERFNNELNFVYSNRSTVNCIVNSLPHLYYKGNGEYILYGHNNSYAAAKVSGIIANILFQFPEISNIKLMKILKAKSEIPYWNSFILKEYIGCPVFQDEKINYDPKRLEELKGHLAEFFDLKGDKDVFYKYSLFSSKIGNHSNFAFSLIKYLETIYGKLTEEYSMLSRNDFISIYTLYKVIWEMKK